jgi:hypothetical protein
MNDISYTSRQCNFFYPISKNTWASYSWGTFHPLAKNMFLLSTKTKIGSPLLDFVLDKRQTSQFWKQVYWWCSISFRPSYSISFSYRYYWLYFATKRISMWRTCKLPRCCRRVHLHLSIRIYNQCRQEKLRWFVVICSYMKISPLLALSW